MNWVTTIHNHPQPRTSIHNHPQPLRKLSTTAHKHPEPSTTTHNYPKITQKSQTKTCHMQLFYCTLDVNTETDVDFDSDISNDIHTYVCLCVYIL